MVYGDGYGNGSLIVKQINVSEHMLFLVSINLITIVTILINVHNYRKNKKRM